MSPTGKTIARATAVMMASVLLSRILGYARDAIIAWRHGATVETDAYFAAFTIPDFLNYLLAGGALSITFIPIYAAYLSRNEESKGHRTFSAIATAMGIAMLFFVVLCEFLAERLVPLIAPGFPPEQVATAAHLMRIVLPAQAFFYFGGLLMAVQYSKKSFLVPALAPLVYNAGIIVGGLALGPRFGMDGFAWGVLGGSFVGNFALQAWGAWRCGLRFRPVIDLADPGLREFVRLSIPIMLGFSLVVVDEWVTRIFGSFLLAGTITWLNNARRLMQVPIGVLGQASGVASYPFLSELAANGKTAELWETLGKSIRWVVFASALVAAATAVLSKEVVLLVFKRGAFTIDDTLRTGAALAAFAAGIPFWCAQAVVARGFFAMKDTWTPTVVGTAALVLSLPAYKYLAQSFGVTGLAVASSVGMALHTIALYGLLMRKTVGRAGLSDLPEFAKVAVAGIAAAFLGLYLTPFASRFATWETFIGALIRLGVGTVAVTLTFLATALLLRSTTARGLLAKVLRRQVVDDAPPSLGDQ